jgi:hypothetical protein
MSYYCKTNRLAKLRGIIAMCAVVRCLLAELAGDSDSLFLNFKNGDRIGMTSDAKSTLYAHAIYR